VYLPYIRKTAKGVNLREMKCHVWTYPNCLGIPSLTVLTVMLNVFEVAHSPAAYVTL